MGSLKNERPFSGMFISFEGIDGSGKSTQIRILDEMFRGRGFRTVITREPGGTPSGEKIRNILLDRENRISDVSEMLLYAASRAQLVQDVILPALMEGKVVLCDRFLDSSIAYQGYGRQLGECVGIINQYAVAGYMPDMTFLMKAAPDIGNDRIKNRQKDRIEMENSDFHRRVYMGYEELEKLFPDRIICIDATQSINDIEQSIIRHIRALIGG